MELDDRKWKEMQQQYREASTLDDMRRWIDTVYNLSVKPSEDESVEKFRLNLCALIIGSNQINIVYFDPATDKEKIYMRAVSDVRWMRNCIIY